VGKDSEYIYIFLNMSSCLRRAAADPKGGPEHRSESRPSALQSPGGGRLAVAPPPLPPGPQEAAEQPLSERSPPKRFAHAPRQAAQPRAQTRHLGRQPVQQHGRGARPASDLDPATEPPGRHQDPNGPRGSPQEEALSLLRGHWPSSEYFSICSTC